MERTHTAKPTASTVIADLLRKWNHSSLVFYVLSALAAWYMAMGIGQLFF